MLTPICPTPEGVLLPERDAPVLRRLLREARRIAVVGAKDNPAHPVDMVGRYLMEQGYEVLPVHPKRKGVWGLVTYERLADIPVALDIVNIFRAPECCPGHAREVLALAARPRLFWMQLGIRSFEAAALLAGNGVFIVEDACIMVEHNALFARPHV